MYFVCEARGHNSDNSCSEQYDEFQSYLKPELNSATYLLLSLVPWSNILYAIQFADIKEVIQKIKLACQYNDHSENYSTTFNNTTQI